MKYGGTVEMVIVMNPKCSQNEVMAVKNELINHGLGVNLSQGATFCIIGVVGETRSVDPDKILSFTIYLNLSGLQLSFTIKLNSIISSTTLHSRIILHFN